MNTTHAKRVFEPNEKTKIDKNHKLCLQQVFSSPVTKTVYKNILNNYEMLNEFEQYCSCVTVKLEGEYKLKEEDSLAWKFLDPKKSLEFKDNCALNYLGSESLALNYTIIFNLQFYPLIDSLLGEYHSQNFRTLASVNSYSNHINCLKEKIRSKCSKVHNLRSTHICISETVKDHQSIENLKKECPSFQTEEKLGPTDAEEEFI